MLLSVIRNACSAALVLVLAVTAYAAFTDGGLTIGAIGRACLIGGCIGGALGGAEAIFNRVYSRKVSRPRRTHQTCRVMPGSTVS